jgi:DNA-binding winged helix-turn-helix (wHTH) protein
LRTVVGRGYLFIAPVSELKDAVAPAVGAPLTVSAEDLGRAIMAAAGIEPTNPKGTPKPRGQS